MGVCGNVCCVAAVVKDSVFFSLGVLKYVVCLCKACDGCCVFCVYYKKRARRDLCKTTRPIHLVKLFTNSSNTSNL